MVVVVVVVKVFSWVGVVVDFTVVDDAKITFDLKMFFLIYWQGKHTITLTKKIPLKLG